MALICLNEFERQITLEANKSSVQAVVEQYEGASYTPNVQECEFEHTNCGTWTITCYCHCAQCCGQWATNNVNKIGAMGVPLTSGYSCASSYPFGTLFLVTFQNGESQIFECQDRGVSGKHLDLYFDSHEKALQMASNYGSVAEVEIIEVT